MGNFLNAISSEEGEDKLKDIQVSSAAADPAGSLPEEEEEEKIRKAPEISKKDLKKWSAADVKVWIGFNDFKPGESFSIYSKNLDGLKGKDLEKIQERDLRERGIDEVRHRKRLMKAIRELRTTRMFNYREYIVFRKIEAMTGHLGKNVNSRDWKFLAHALSDPEAMTETYLNPSILQESLDEYIIGKEEQEVKPIKKQDEGREDEGEGDLKDEEVEGEGESEGGLGQLVKDVVPEHFSLRDTPKEKLSLPVKLVVTEMVRSNHEKTARRLLSPVLAHIPHFSKTFGIFHTALIIGPWYIEWIDSSLCIPRKLYSGMALISADVEASLVLNNMSFEDISKRLANTICRWNTTRTYKNMTNKNSKHSGNCQDFVEDVMATFSMKFEKQGAFGKFLADMKGKGECELVFTPNKTFKERFKLNLNRYRFDSHEELDNFVHELAKVDDIALRMDFVDEEKLLKSFDRAFWLRHFKKPNDEKFKPSRMDCPFDDPRKTKSYIVYS